MIKNGLDDFRGYWTIDPATSDSIDRLLSSFNHLTVHSSKRKRPIVLHAPVIDEQKQEHEEGGSGKVTWGNGACLVQKMEITKQRRGDRKPRKEVEVLEVTNYSLRFGGGNNAVAEKLNATSFVPVSMMSARSKGSPSFLGLSKNSSIRAIPSELTYYSLDQSRSYSLNMKFMLVNEKNKKVGYILDNRKACKDGQRMKQQLVYYKHEGSRALSVYGPSEPVVVNRVFRKLSPEELADLELVFESKTVIDQPNKSLPVAEPSKMSKTDEPAAKPQSTLFLENFTTGVCLRITMMIFVVASSLLCVSASFVTSIEQDASALVVLGSVSTLYVGSKYCEPSIAWLNNSSLLDRSLLYLLVLCTVLVAAKTDIVNSFNYETFSSKQGIGLVLLVSSMALISLAVQRSEYIWPRMAKQANVTQRAGANAIDNIQARDEKVDVKRVSYAPDRSVDGSGGARRPKYHIQRVEITDYRINFETSTQFIEYKIVVFFAADPSTHPSEDDSGIKIIYRRYSEFRTLRKLLLSSPHVNLNTSDLPTLPTRRLFSNFSEVVLETRKVGLNIFLQTVFACLTRQDVRLESIEEISAVEGCTFFAKESSVIPYTDLMTDGLESGRRDTGSMSKCGFDDLSGSECLRIPPH